VLRGERVRDALAELPEAQREALVLAYFGGYTQREIAGLTSTPLGTVKTRMLAGMRRMRGGLDGVATVGQDPLAADGGAR
jgi:RNA polymerase sigma-70 factor (ECF subfamily)